MSTLGLCALHKIQRHPSTRLLRLQLQHTIYRTYAWKPAIKKGAAEEDAFAEAFNQAFDETASIGASDYSHAPSSSHGRRRRRYPPTVEDYKFLRQPIRPPRPSSRSRPHLAKFDFIDLAEYQTPTQTAVPSKAIQPHFDLIRVTADIFTNPRFRPQQEHIYKLPYPEDRSRSNRFIFHTGLFYQSDPRPECPDPRDSPPSPENYRRPMLVYAQVVVVPTADSPGPLVMLHTELRSYAFGRLAEGAQRVCAQRKMRLARLDELFVSGPVAWSSVGGMMGLILSISDILTGSEAVNARDNPLGFKKRRDPEGRAWEPKLKIHGGQNIAHTIATTRRFILRKGLPLRLHEIAHEPVAESRASKPDFEDSAIKVWYMSLLPGDTEPAHGRKRSHEDMEAEDAGEDGQVKARAESKGLVQSAIDHMFDTNWNMDTLVETTLHNVDGSYVRHEIFVRKNGKLEKYNGPVPGSGKEVEDIPVLARKRWQNGFVSSLPPTTPSKQSVSYFVKQHPRRGKFNVVAATEAGVPKRDFKHLAAGRTVKGKDDMDVTPEMCVAPDIDGRAFAFLDLPDASYVDALIARPEWKDEAMTGTLDVIYWNLGRGVVHDERIQTFIKDRQEIHHVVFSPEASPNSIAYQSAAMQTQKLNSVDPDRFPLPVLDNKPQYSPPDKIFTEGRSMFQHQLAPQSELKQDGIVPRHTLNWRYAEIDPRSKESARAAQKAVKDPKFLENIEATETDIPCRDAEVIALGTGSSLPSKYRNVSATLVRIPGHGSYLFDAGEGTLGQLRRMFGYAKADEILADLKLIWISHIHADHHLGTVSVIKAWHDVTAAAADPSLPVDQLPRLFVASHSNMLDWLREYADVEDYGHSRVHPISIQGNVAAETRQNPYIFSADLERAAGGLSRIDAVRVDHCAGAYACLLTWTDLKFTVAYSGDCRPSKLFTRVARGATLLIHEATLEDRLQVDAESKRHCTMGEALWVAKEMQARRVLLTHFSQRYPGIPNEVAARTGLERQREALEVEDQVVLLAFDQMSVKLGDFKKAALFLPALRRMLEKTDFEADEGSGSLGPDVVSGFLGPDVVSGSGYDVGSGSGPTF